MVTITGSGFTANGTLAATTGLTIGGLGTNPTPIAVNADGALTGSAQTVPAGTAYGGNIVLATDSGALTGSTSFTAVQPTIAINPTSGPVGTTVTVTGSGWLPNRLVTVTRNSSAALTVTANRLGEVTAQLPIPSSLFSATGDSVDVTVGANDGETGNTAAGLIFKINSAAITVTPGVAAAGDTVTVTGRNYLPSGGLTVFNIGGVSVLPPDPVTSNATGSWMVSFTVPGLSGVQTITTTHSGVTKTATLTIATAGNVVADLAVTKTATGAAVTGQDLTYTIVVANAGPSNASGVVITDRLPTGTTLVGASEGGREVNGVVTWSGLSIPAGSSRRLDLTVRLDPDLAGPITNAASIVSADQPDPNREDNIGSTGAIGISGSADLSVAKTAAGAAVAGQDLTYTIVVANAGPSNASGVVITDRLPAGASFVSASEGGSEVNGVVTWSGLSIPAGNSRRLDLMVRLDPDLAGTITNTASVGADQPDPSVGSNSASVETMMSPDETDSDRDLGALTVGFGTASTAVGLAGLIISFRTTLNAGGRWAMRLAGRLTLRRRQQEGQSPFYVKPALSRSQTVLATIWGLLAGGGSLATLRETLSNPPAVELVLEMVIPVTLLGFFFGIRRLRR